MLHNMFVGKRTLHAHKMAPLPTRPEYLENRIRHLLVLKNELEEEVLQLQSAVRVWTDVANLMHCARGRQTGGEPPG